jgi:hypothetical protein
MSTKKCPHTKDDCNACGECRKKIAELNATIDRLNALLDRKLAESIYRTRSDVPKREEAE